ncbi:hypothetical protein FKM82_030638 [Ascaphus truei]
MMSPPRQEVQLGPVDSILISRTSHLPRAALPLIQSGDERDCFHAVKRRNVRTCPSLLPECFLGFKKLANLSSGRLNNEPRANLFQ